MALVNCPQCDKRMSTLEDSCPHCGYRDKPRPSGAAAGGLRTSASRGTFSLSIDSAVPGTPDADEWIRRWANLCGGMLIFGFLCPVIVTMFRETEVMWTWSLMSHAKAPEAVGMLLPLVLGIGTLIVGNRVEGIQRPIILFAMAGVNWILHALLAGPPGEFKGSGSTGAFVLLLMPLAAGAIAIGNRIRKRHPREGFPRHLAGVGGIVLVVCFLIPVGGEGARHPLIAAFFESMAWRFMGPIMLVFLALLGYGVMGAFSLMGVRDVASFCRLLSVQARILLLGTPLTLLLTFWMFTNGAGFIMALTFTLKTFATWYGHLLLFVIGLTSWIEYSMEKRRGRAA